jgi:hypothetical protein
MGRRYILLASGLVVAGCVQAQSVDDALAIRPEQSESNLSVDGRTQSLELELAGVGYRWRPETFVGEEPSTGSARLSATWRLRHPFNNRWSLIVNDALDIGWYRHEKPFVADNVRHTLQEAYLSGRLGGSYIDAGRFNERIGVAYGYSPNDVFRRHTIISRVSEDPIAMRNNRLGTVGMRVQQLFERGSLVAVVAPRLRQRASEAVLSPYLERTNSDWQASLRAGVKLPLETQLEGVAHYRERGRVQWGVNLSTGLGDSVTAYVEYAASPDADVISRALALDPGRPFAQTSPLHSHRSRYSVGLTVTPKPNVTIGLEAQGDDTALDRGELRLLMAPATPSQLQTALAAASYASETQDNLGRHYGLLRASWTNICGSRVSASSFVRWNVLDHSRFSWLQLEYPHASGSTALALAHMGGDKATEYGNGRARVTAQLSINWHF